MKIKHCLLSVLFCVQASAFSQDTTYFNTEWAPCKKENASYFSVLAKVDSLWRITDHFIENGNIQMEGTLNAPDRSRRHGDFVWYNDDGSVFQTGQYKNGRRHGRLIWFTPSGDTATIETYRNGIGHGPSVSYYPNGNLNTRGSFTDGRRDGKCEYYFENGKVGFVGSFKNGVKIGKWIFGDPAGNTEERDYLDVLKSDKYGFGFELPNHNWYDAGSAIHETLEIFSLHREALAGQNNVNIIPVISIVCSKIEGGTALEAFTAKWLEASKVKIDKVLTRDIQTFRFDQAIAYTGTTALENGETHSLVLLDIVHKDVGIHVVMEMPADIYKNYGNEFMEALEAIHPLE